MRRNRLVQSVARAVPLLSACALLAVTAGCGIPHDPEETYRRVLRRTVRVGVCEHPPFTVLEEGKPRGIEADLIKGFARQLDATVRWHRGTEGPLIEALGQGKLDVVIGGLKESSPWSSHAGATQPYVEAGGEKFVMFVRQGENRWLLELDKYLHTRKNDAAMRLARRLPP